VVTLSVLQTAGTPQNIAFAVVGSLPPGVTVTITPNPHFSSGNVTVVFHVTPFAPDGTFPIIIQSLCGSTTYNFVYSLTLTPCYDVHVNNSVQNYNLRNALGAMYGSAVLNGPVCVVNTVDPGIYITSPNVNAPAYTTGNLPAGSIVALVNNGNIIGKGGDGGSAYDPALGLTGAGQTGGTAVEARIRTYVQNNFNIYGGGGGGGSMAFELSTPNIPVIGPIFFLIGSGGGGGAGGGAGGTAPGSVGIAFYAPGFAGTAGQFGIPGSGGLLVAPITQAVGPATFTINPNTIGGNGGAYGYPGTTGTFQVTLTVTVTVPIIGNITIINGLNLPIPVPAPAAGLGGYAIKRVGGATVNIPDNLYNTSALRGKVGP
jgi:hypothetical protein